MTFQTGTELPSYKTPPLEEVACGCQFRSLDRMKLPHVGIFWERFKKDFPIVEHALPIATDNNYPAVDSATGLPWPRVWFLNETESRLIQLQSDRIFFNWRRRETAPLYPRYPEVIRSFAEMYKTFCEFANDMNLGQIQPEALELTYTNHLIQGQCWEEFEDLGKIFKDFHWHTDPHRYLPTPAVGAWQSSYELPSNHGKLNVKIVQAKKAVDNTTIYLFDISARGMSGGSGEAAISEWFDKAHEYIVRAFTDLTLPGIQYETWGREK